MTAVDLSDVQGNILKGFDKPNIRLIFFKFGNDEDQTKAWLRAAAKKIRSNTELIHATEELKRRKRSDPQYHPQDIWLHVSLSKSGINDLNLPIPPSAEIYDVTERGTTVLDYDDSLNYPFKEGMKARAHILGDTDDSAPEKWVEPFTYRVDADGKEINKIDALFIVASDEDDDGDSYALRLIEEATLNGAICVGVQRGKALENEAGKQVEHFGFRDGISQPLINGIDDDDIKKRKFNKDEFMPEDFVLYGLKGEHEWANNGSFLVFRRLRQDVSGFWESMNVKSKELGLTPEELAAKFVGRWKSGAPLAKYPEYDPVSLKDFDFNDFAYCDNNQQVAAEAPPPNDPRGEVTPRFGHIRKANPRDDGRHEGLPENCAENRKHRILRRGITYGVPWAKDPKADRGLLFISFQRDIKEQFEYIQNLWANKSNFPLPDVQLEGAISAMATLTEHGPDPISGQHHSKESVNLLHSDGKFKPIELKQWVTVTGGEYFFSPSISALKQLKTKNLESPAFD